MLGLGPSSQDLSRPRVGPPAAARAREVRAAAGVEPPHDAVVAELERPPVLVDELVMERADQHQVVEVRAPAVRHQMT